MAARRTTDAAVFVSEMEYRSIEGRVRGVRPGLVRPWTNGSFYVLLMQPIPVGGSWLFAFLRGASAGLGYAP